MRMVHADGLSVIQATYEMGKYGLICALSTSDFIFQLLFLFFKILTIAFSKFK